METAQFLSAAITPETISQSFFDQCQKMNFHKMADILQTEPQVLLNQKGFTYHWLSELSIFLKAKDLLHLLQPIPGSIAGR